MIYKGINFNGTHYRKGDLQVWCNWDDTSSVLFVGERLVALVKVWANAKPIVKVISYINGIILKVIYNCDANGYFILDVTDIMRTFTKSDEVYVTIRRDEDPDTKGEIRILHHHNNDEIFLRDPWKVPIPKSSIQGLLITPPSRMLKSDAVSLMAQSFIWEEEGAAVRQWKYRQIGESSYTDISNGANFYIQENGVEILSDKGEGGTFELAPTECGVRYAMIKWCSFVGSYKMHNFVIKSQKTETQDDYSLLMMDNSYNQIKGSEESLVFSIDELNTYDLWYYSDILTSSEVSLLALDGKFIGSDSQGHLEGGIRLEITTKSVTVPSGERADGKLEFEAKIKRYDAVTL